MWGGQSNPRLLQVACPPLPEIVVDTSLAKGASSFVHPTLTARARLRMYWLENVGWTKAPVLLRVTCPPLLKTVMEYTKNNQSRAAILLGWSRGTLRKKLKIPP